MQKGLEDKNKKMRNFKDIVQYTPTTKLNYNTDWILFIKNLMIQNNGIIMRM
jgi:hypothetical protein